MIRSQLKRTQGDFGGDSSIVNAKHDLLEPDLFVLLYKKLYSRPPPFSTIPYH